MATSKNRLAWIGFILSMFCAIITGLNMSFNVYAIPIKRTFNLTQSQVEILIALDGLGLGLGFLEILLFNACGYKITILLSWLLVPISSGVLSIASFYNQYFSNSPGLLYVAQFIMALGNVLVTMVNLRVLFLICPDKHTGKLVGMVFAMQCTGKLVFAGLMDLFFFTKLAGFFLTICCASLGLFTINFLVVYAITKDVIGMESSLRIDPHETVIDLNISDFEGKSGQSLVDSDLQTSSSEKKALITDSNRKRINSCDQLQSKSVPSAGEENQQMTSIKDILLSGFFHLVIWPAVLYYSVPFLIMNNITTISESVGLQHAMDTVYTISILIIATRLTVGVILDKFPSVIAGLVFLLLGDLCIGAALLLGMFWLNTTTVLAITILTGLGLGSGFTTCAPMLLRRYGKQHCAFISSFFYMILTVFVFVSQLIFGFVYDSRVERRGDIFCYGRDCFFDTFCVLLGVLAFVLTIQAPHLCYTLYFA